MAQRLPLPGIGDGQPGDGVVVQGDGPRHQLRRFGGQAGDEDVSAPLGPHGGGDAGNLLRRLARPVDHLRRPLAHPPVEVHLGVAQVGEGLPLQLGQGFLRGGGAVGHLAEQL